MRNKIERALWKAAILFVAVVLVVVDPLLAQSPFYLKDGDRVVFYGDSITDQRLYTTFAETFVLTRFPNLKVSFVHSGWGGDRVTGGGGGPIDVRLKRDVIAYHPTVVTIMLGMNDGGYKPYDEATFETYANGYRHIIETLKSALPGVRMTLLEPSPYDDVTRDPNFPGGYNAVLVRYAAFVKELADQPKLAVADLNTPLVAALHRASEIGGDLAKSILPDRVHPGPAGHLLMAEAVLKAWHAPALVTDVQISAADHRIARSENTKVSGLSTDGGLAWTQLDNALPMPVDMSDKVVALAIHSSDFANSMDREFLQVTGLTAPRYDLKIDGEEAANLTREQLADGINLALLPTPMTKQAAEVHSLTLRHNNVHFARWRTVQVPLEKESLPSAEKAITALDSLETDLVKQQRAAAIPKPHHYQLRESIRQ
ncbi:MAG TPA: SGNH/GDSL hydrolase family protein [Bryobacteraceae bacterium]|nr:SGNH/GDSL hydrolase family protein [Bryobacteraceae bacterium]